MPFPEAINVNRQAGTMEIVWNDGQSYALKLIDLRRSCPCAACAQERGENPHPGLLDAPPPKPEKKKSLSLPLLSDVQKFAIVSLHHVGNYALGVTWQDNHNSIFTWQFLADEALKADD